MSACDVSIDVDNSSLAELEHVQISFIRRLLGISKHSPIAILFSETGMWPVKYRRLMLALRYWQYALSLPNDHFLSYAIADATTLALEAKSSWISDLINALLLLLNPVLVDPAQNWSPGDIDGLIEKVEQSCLDDIDAFIRSSPKAFMLHYCSPRTKLPNDNHRQRKSEVLAFHSYLSIPQLRSSGGQNVGTPPSLAVNIYAVIATLKSKMKCMCCCIAMDLMMWTGCNPTSS
ncbi:uncharacterized protein EV420DRAFT_1652676 [Desarmillaria tabescens]|uniref:Uncharacterized protein n=1 Tax=Armillaria tabescens TaxID=1929756 RepID=A0AA39J882_ARMTA|nr:uncharacterized protein EV420DRAFT_1652676 [Desarmillaria tabescens]KAK0436048.1 hypothetical protein EV420DRAFT_1652676 [Desarmillaria tabescens]